MASAKVHGAREQRFICVAPGGYCRQGCVPYVAVQQHRGKLASDNARPCQLERLEHVLAYGEHGVRSKHGRVNIRPIALGSRGDRDHVHRGTRETVANAANAGARSNPDGAITRFTVPLRWLRRSCSALGHRRFQSVPE